METEDVTAGTAGESRLVVYVGISMKQRLLKLAAERGSQLGRPVGIGEFVRELLAEATHSDPVSTQRRRRTKRDKPQAA